MASLCWARTRPRGSFTRICSSPRTARKALSNVSLPFTKEIKSENGAVQWTLPMCATQFRETREALEREGMEGEKGTVCVTGAGGFLGSWLVKLLLSKGYRVHGTLRDPDDEKNNHLRKLEKATDNLLFFKADLLDYDTLEAAIVGCEGVFHVASPVPSTKVPNPEVEIIRPAAMGTLNVLKACSLSKVKRVVVVSSAAAVSKNPNWPKGRVMDEDCWSDKDYCKNTENWYCLSKTLAEEEAAEYAKKHGLDVIVVCPCTITGPMLQSTVNSSSLFIINLLKGRKESMENRTRHYVDVRDVADALVLVYEKPEACGRYICAPHPIKISNMVQMFKSMYPNYNYPKNYTEVDSETQLSSEKLRMLGWKCRTLKESFNDAVEHFQKAGLLEDD